MMPLPVTLSAPGISTARLPIWMPNLPGTLKAESRSPPPVMALSAANTSTLMSKVPSRPVSFAVMPLLDCALPPPKLRLATSTPMATVRTSFLSLVNCIFASVTDGPSSDSGPRAIAFDAAPAVCSVAEMVKSSSVRMFVTALAPVPTRQLPATTWTLISPATNRFFGSTPVLGVSR